MLHVFGLKKKRKSQPDALKPVKEAVEAAYKALKSADIYHIKKKVTPDFDRVMEIYYHLGKATIPNKKKYAKDLVAKARYACIEYNMEYNPDIPKTLQPVILAVEDAYTALRDARIDYIEETVTADVKRVMKIHDNLHDVASKDSLVQDLIQYAKDACRKYNLENTPEHQNATLTSAEQNTQLRLH